MAGSSDDSSLLISRSPQDREAETELAFHTGEMPKEGNMVTVVLHDKTVKARVGARTFQRSKEGSGCSLCLNRSVPVPLARTRSEIASSDNGPLPGRRTLLCLPQRNFPLFSGVLFSALRNGVADFEVVMYYATKGGGVTCT